MRQVCAAVYEWKYASGPSFDMQVVMTARDCFLLWTFIMRYY